MQLGFDRQHFTLPRVGISLRLNKSLPATPKKLYVSLTCGAFLFDFVVKGLVTDQFHLVRIVERLPEPGSHRAIHRSRPLRCSNIAQHRTLSAGDCS
ncbi:hypothetical protein VRB50_19985 [Pseudomonas poae]|nr:hypothetical protein [Pseudomonas poae]